jgi:hypothetical protein
MRYGGLDAHKDFVQACWVDERNKVVREERFDTTPAANKTIRPSFEALQGTPKAASRTVPQNP